MVVSQSEDMHAELDCADFRKLLKIHYLLFNIH